MNELKRKRLQLNLTLKDVAKTVGVSESTVSRWERAEIDNIRRDHISAYALALGMSPLEILSTNESNDSIINLASQEEIVPEDRLMAYWRGLNDTARKKIEEYAMDLYNNPSYKR